MQADMEEHWQAMADKKRLPRRPQDEEIGWNNHPWYVKLVGDMFYDRGMLPNTGGLNQQDEETVFDIMRYIAGRAFYERSWMEAHKDDKDQQ
jgi:hypothetical protein